MNTIRLVAVAAVLVAVLVGFACAPSAHAAPPAKAQLEIDALMAALEKSGCRFERNGSWYDAARARGHLQEKYDYLRRHDMVDTAEQFIDRAATQSSMSGKPYHVQCAGKPLATSHDWFVQQLRAMRAGARR